MDRRQDQKVIGHGGIIKCAYMSYTRVSCNAGRVVASSTSSASSIVYKPALSEVTSLLSSTNISFYQAQLRPAFVHTRLASTAINERDEARPLTVVKDRLKGNCGEGWLGWLRAFSRAREFTIEWDGKVRWRDKTNVGAPQGSTESSATGEGCQIEEGR